ncbi:ORF2 [torque teno Delphinidae virus 4]
MGLTGEERSWITTCLISHGLFCRCGDPIGHLSKCLIIQTEEDLAVAAATEDLDGVPFLGDEPDDTGGNDVAEGFSG